MSDSDSESTTGAARPRPAVPHVATGAGVTIPIARHAAEPVGSVAISSDEKPKYKFQERFIKLWGTSLSQEESEVTRPCANGFVDSCILAYNWHRHLVLRADDVWLAVLAQFSFYVRAHAEELREHFVEHEGKMELAVEGWDMEDILHLFEGEIRTKVKDEKTVDWLLPEFTTTTRTDRTVGIALMMATMKNYFEYVADLACGIPSVTLMGTVEDWEKLYSQIDGLLIYDINNEMKEWHSMLEPVLYNFVQSYRNPESQSSEDFWQLIAHYSGGGSGPTYLSGWITAFIAFNPDGKWQLDSEWIKSGRGASVKGCVISGASKQPKTYTAIWTSYVTQAWAEVDVKINDTESILAAGLVGYKYRKIVDGKLEDKGEDNDTVVPVPAWWCFEAKTQEELVREKEEKKHEFIKRLEDTRRKAKE